ncbi:unnamed protein product [Symbiodinium sp. CCMP2592]|nr:unnamed protein product [Symbiodinium sp. CCMP2592]
MDIVPFVAAAGDSDGQRTEAAANRYVPQLLQENNQVNICVSDPRIQQALELRAERRHQFVLDNIYAEAHSYIAHLEATTDANHRQQLAFVRESTMVLVGQLHNETRVLEQIAHNEQRSAREYQAQLTRTQQECHDERSLAMQFDAHRSELEAAAREQQYDSLVDDLQDRNAELIGAELLLGLLLGKVEAKVAKGDKADKGGRRSPSGKHRRPSKKSAKSEDKTAACCLSLAATLTVEPSSNAGKSFALAAPKGPTMKPKAKKVQFLRPEIIDIPLEGEGWRFVTEKRKYDFRFKPADQCPPSDPEDTEEALQNARHLESAVNGMRLKVRVKCNVPVFGDRGPLVACTATKSSDSDGSKGTPHQRGENMKINLKAQLDDVWSLLEDSVNIDELDGIYGEVPEGTIATITLFALPEGEVEAQADSDVEPYAQSQRWTNHRTLIHNITTSVMSKTHILLWGKGGYNEDEIQEQLSQDLDEMFPELFGPDRDKDPPPKDAKATRKGEPESDSRAALLDDVPFSVKQKLTPSAAVAAQQPPYGYVWSGECLVKKNNKNRPNAIDHTAWKAMSKRQRATAIAEHEKK